MQVVFQVLAVNVLCQTSLWDVLSHMVEARCLAEDALEALSKALASIQPSEGLALCFSRPGFLEAALSRPALGRCLLSHLRQHARTFSCDALEGLIRSLDPARPACWPAVIPALASLRSRTTPASSLESTIDSGQEDRGGRQQQPPDQLAHLVTQLMDTYACLLIAHAQLQPAYDIHLLRTIQVRLVHLGMRQRPQIRQNARATT